MTRKARNTTQRGINKYKKYDYNMKKDKILCQAHAKKQNTSQKLQND